MLYYICYTCNYFSDNAVLKEDVEMTDEKEVEEAKSVSEKESNEDIVQTEKAEPEQKTDGADSGDNEEGKPNGNVDNDADILELGRFEIYTCKNC